MLEENIIHLDSPDQKRFTSYRFYSELLSDLNEYYRSDYKGAAPVISLDRSLRIDPSVLPLLMALGAFLKEFHKQSISLEMDNDLSSNGIIRFLQQSDFLHIVGDHDNPNWPNAKRIFKFNREAIGQFSQRGELRFDHKIHLYSRNDPGLRLINLIDDGEKRRDALIEHFSFLATSHFENLVNDIGTDNFIKTQFVQIISELITNGIFHSGSDVYMMMFSNRFKTSCSIADIGVGLFDTIMAKEKTAYYNPGGLMGILSQKITVSMAPVTQKCAFSIFETFYYSMLKDRQGMFDLMLKVVIRCQGYFRLHYDNVQIIVSSRMLNELSMLQEIRTGIWRCHSWFLLNPELSDEYHQQMLSLSDQGQKAIISLAEGIFRNYTQDVQFSAIRIFQVRFKGVHVEAEIPTNVN
ncbi:hypothetical protein [Pedobacter paludis]|uniref:Uncharacterized protein n=1 Tax=Pedobacter paludis TaxID=2203212 RepID=A0A317F2I6_9SPHI|nr:hypothetical protein [Pedobacter paludis]PWS33384.1 hypothetical protein DF947_01790 [Pedobacter paludis]